MHFLIKRNTNYIPKKIRPPKEMLKVQFSRYLMIIIEQPNLTNFKWLSVIFTKDITFAAHFFKGLISSDE
jgi:hypothetical protein